MVNIGFKKQYYELTHVENFSEKQYKQFTNIYNSKAAARNTF